MTNQRQYRRIPFHADGEVQIAATVYPCELLDIALRGALFRAPHPLPVAIGEAARIKIILADNQLELTFGAELIHHNDDQYGFLFASEDVETLTHLRRLLELNFGDAEAAEQEFAHWLKKDAGHTPA